MEVGEFKESKIVGECAWCGEVIFITDMYLEHEFHLTWLDKYYLLTYHLSCFEEEQNESSDK